MFFIAPKETRRDVAIASRRWSEGATWAQTKQVTSRIELMLFRLSASQLPCHQRHPPSQSCCPLLSVSIRLASLLPRHHARLVTFSSLPSLRSSRLPLLLRHLLTKRPFISREHRAPAAVKRHKIQTARSYLVLEKVPPIESFSPVAMKKATASLRQGKQPSTVVRCPSHPHPSSASQTSPTTASFSKREKCHLPEHSHYFVHEIELRRVRRH